MSSKSLLWFIFVLVLLCPILTLCGAEESNTLIKCKNSSYIGDSLEIPKHLMMTKKPQTFMLSNNSKALNCEEDEYIPISLIANETLYKGKGNITNDGILMLHAEDDFIYHRQIRDYCVQSARDGEIVLAVCPMKCLNIDDLSKSGLSDARPCIHKCCTNPRKIFTMENNRLTCHVPKKFHEYQNFTSKPFLLEDVSKKVSKKGSFVYPNYFADKRFAKCENSVIHILKVPKHVYSGNYHSMLNIGIFRLISNGNVEGCSSDNKTIVMDTDNMCVDALQNFGEGKGESGDLITLAIMLCKPHSDKDNGKPSNKSSIEKNKSSTDDTKKTMDIILYFVSLPLACILLFVIIVVYLLLWDTQNVHGRTVLFYIISLFLLFFSLPFTKAWHFKTLGCKINGVLSHFFFISTFCWLTAINFDIFWTFRKLQISSKLKNSKQLIIYAIVCLTTPSIFVTVGLSLDYSYKTEKPLSTCSLEEDIQESSSRVLTPQYGIKSCYISEEAKGWYDYFIGGVLLSCNAVFFGLTVYKLCQYRKSANTAIQASSQEDQPVKIFGKLLAIMGAGWIFEFIGWAIRSGTGNSSGTAWMIYICDSVTLLQAVALCYVFVWKKAIFVQLWQKYRNLRRILIIFITIGLCEVPQDKRPSNTGNVTITSNTLGRTGIQRNNSKSLERNHSLKSKDSIEMRKISLN